MKASKYQLPAVLAVFSVIVSAMPSSAQLPPVNWGKSVHGPGDNQYVGGGDQQGMRHPPNTTPTRPAMVPMMGGGGGGPVAYRPTPKRPKPDISLQPIPADEPVTPPGFPPLPDRLDLPGVDNTTATTFEGSSGGGGGGGVGGGGGGGGPRGGGAPSVNPFQGKKQGYAHYEPGAFSGQTRGGGGAPMSGGGGGGGGDFHQNYNHAAPGSFAEQPKGVGYYKCGERANPNKPVAFEESFGSDSANKPPAYTGASAADLKKLGREPKLNDRQNGGDSQPEAPTPVSINQTATQDLSLPDDDFRSRRPPNKAGKVAGRIAKRVGNRAGAMMNRGMSMATMGLTSGR